MTLVLQIILPIFWGAVVLSFLVAIHEAGHFIAARLFGMRVTEFFIGMPCKYRWSYKLKRWGTEIGITPLLLGGYTRICGMAHVDDELLEQCLTFVYTQGRTTAGACAKALGCSTAYAHELLAVLADWASIQKESSDSGDSEQDIIYTTVARDDQMLTLFDTGHQFLAEKVKPAGSAYTLSDSHQFFLDEKARTYTGKSFIKRFIALAAGPCVNIVFAFVVLVATLSLAGVTTTVDSNVLGKVEANSLAQDAGLSTGDEIVALDGEPVHSWTDIVRVLSDKMKDGATFEMKYVHDGQQVRSTVDFSHLEPHELFGIHAQTKVVYPSIGQSLQFATAYTVQVTQFVCKLIMPQYALQTVQQSSSVVGISTMAARAAEEGAQQFFMLAAMISMSLGCMNLLPIPPLDGGKALFEIIGVVIRKPVPLKIQTFVTYIGIALFLLLFVFALRNDIAALIQG